MKTTKPSQVCPEPSEVGPQDQGTPQGPSDLGNEAGATSQAAKKKTVMTPLQAVAELCRRGHHEFLPRLRELLQQSPQVFRYVGDMGRQAQQAWADMIAGPDHLLRESLVFFAEEMKVNLVGKDASRLEMLAAERIVGAWMEVQYFRMWWVQHPEAKGTKLGLLHQKRFEEADRRLERALTSLAMIKKVLPQTIRVELLHPPMPPSPPAPGLGSQPDSHAASGKRSPRNGAARQFGPVNRVGEHFRAHHEQSHGAPEACHIS